MIAQARNRVAPTIEDVWQRYLAQEKEEDSLYAALYNPSWFQIFETDPEKMTVCMIWMDGVTVIRVFGYSSEIQTTVVAANHGSVFYAQMQKRGNQ